MAFQSPMTMSAACTTSFVAPPLSDSFASSPASSSISAPVSPANGNGGRPNMLHRGSVGSAANAGLRGALLKRGSGSGPMLGSGPLPGSGANTPTMPTNSGGGGGSGPSTPRGTPPRSSGPPPMHHFGAPPSGPRHMHTRSVGAPNPRLPRNSPPHSSHVCCRVVLFSCYLRVCG